MRCLVRNPSFSSPPLPSPHLPSPHLTFPSRLSRCPRRLAATVIFAGWLGRPAPSSYPNPTPPPTQHLPHELEFGEHVLRHSEAADSPALHPPGCALRAYGCRACRVSINATAARAATAGSGSGSGSGGMGDRVPTSGVGNDHRAVGSCYSYEAAAAAAAAAAAVAVSTCTEGGGQGHVTSTACASSSSSSSSSDEVTVSADDGSHSSAAVSYSYEAAATAAAEAAGVAAATTAGTATEELDEDGVEEEGAAEELEQSRARGHDNPGMCPWYRIQCKSCEQEVPPACAFLSCGCDPVCCFSNSFFIFLFYFFCFFLSFRAGATPAFFCS